MKNFIINTTTGEYILTLCVNEKNVDVFLTKVLKQSFENLPKTISFRNVYEHLNVLKDFDTVYKETKDCINHAGIWLDNNE